MACVAVNSLLRTLEIEFLQSQPRSIVEKNQLISPNKDLLQSLHQKLELLMELFDENRMKNVETIKELETKLRDIAFRVEDEIELQVVDLYKEERFGITSPFIEKPKGNTTLKVTWHSRRLCHILQQAMKDLDAIKEKLEKVKVVALQGKKTTLNVFPKYNEVIMKGDSSQLASHLEEKMVGKNNDFNIIKDMLIRHPSKRQQVVSIEGMGGIGKTTLARRVYEDLSIASHFDKRAWCVASQSHNKRLMLVSLLKSIFGEANVGNENEDELALQLYQCLKGQRYFVVMDDVWSGEAWNVVEACFPDDGNGSRVLLTTRLSKVAKYNCFDDNFSFQMQLLDQSESWKLFYKKACKSRNAEFERIGRRIVEKCKGLPLAIVVVAGLFSKLNTLDEWENYAETLNSSSITTIDEECSRVLSLSYNYLHHNLKACFLYLGVFPEDTEIKANELTRLWSAEGLVKTYENESNDAVAKRYIHELMERNLILVSQRSSCGKTIKTFRMHDLLHAFVVREAQNENLLHVVRKNDSDFSQKVFRWLRIQSDFESATLCSYPKNCRSIFCFFWDLYLNLQTFNLLRVLHFNFSTHPKNFSPVHLRYMSLPYSPQSYQKSVELPGRAYMSLPDYTVESGNFWNLQTLHIMFGEGIHYMECPQLQHLYPSNMGVRLPYFIHRNLQSILCLNPSQCTDELFAIIPYVKKLGILGERRDCNNSIENLVNLQHLERLSIESNGGDPLDMIPINNQIILLKNLKKLTFDNMRYEWKEINVLSKLPMLEVLKLKRDACIGKEWELVEKDKFCQLIALQIVSTDLQHWKARGHQFPKLERLLLRSCIKLEEIPIQFAEILTLKSIELFNCLPSTLTSAKQIQEEQCDYGNDDMIVIEKDTIEFGKDEFVEDRPIEGCSIA